METKNVENSKIVPFLVAGGVASLFPLYVCQSKPVAASQCVISDAGIQGCAVTGRSCDLNWIYSYWMTATNKYAMLSLLKNLREINGEDIQLNFPIEYVDEVQSIFPEKETTKDHLYVLIPSKFRESKTKYHVTPLTEKLLNQVDISSELKQVLGSDYKAYDSIPFYGIIIENQLASIADAICDSGTYTAIQQVYTNTAHRGNGIGTMLVGEIAASLIKQNRIPAYWVAEENHSSIRLVEKLGFELSLRLGCAD